MKLNSPEARFGFSLLAALVVSGLTWRSLERARHEADAVGPASDVIVVRKPVAAGHTVGAADLDVRPVPLEYTEPGAFHDIKAVKGIRARISLVKGEQLTRSKIENESSRLGLAWTLPPGSVAMSLRLPSENAVGGHALPGDWVAVFSAESRQAPAVPIVRRARIVAIQDRLWEPSGAPPSPISTAGSNESLLVTLMLTPEQVSRVATAVDRGRLTLALLSPLDDRSPDVAENVR